MQSAIANRGGTNFTANARILLVSDAAEQLIHMFYTSQMSQSVW